MPDASGSSLHLPDGWQHVLLKDLGGSLQAGPAARTQDKGRTKVDGGIPVVLPRDLHGQRITTAEPAAVPAVSWDRKRMLDKYLLAEGDILIIRTGTIGRLALVTQEHGGWLFHSNLVRIRLPDRALAQSSYLAAYLSSRTAQDWIRTRAAGAVIPSISTRTLGELPVLLPPPAEQQAIGATLAALDDKVRAHTEIARATSEYRTELADVLMAGVLSGRV